jgi:anaerobic selenocysteine-containing dehydrogenase
MSEKITRRDFLKLAGAGGAIATVLTGCGPASRYVTREPYYAMPEYNTNGQSTYYATLCRECAAGCGLVVRTMQGRALKVEGNKKNPVNLGKTCARGQVTLQGLYNPDRIQNPVKLVRDPGNEAFAPVTWDEAISTVTESLQNEPSQVAFLMGLAPDHLFDLVNTLGLNPVRYGALSMFEARATLTEASRRVFGKPSLLFFDMAGSDVTFSFGANFLETWVSPVAYTRGFAKMRQGTKGRRGYLVQFEPRMSQTAMVADEWIPVKPGTEGLVALAVGRLAAEIRGVLPQAFLDANVDEIAELAGIEKETLERLARIYANAAHPLALPGGSALGHTNGLGAAQAILALNALVGNIGQPGGVFITPGAGIDEYHRPANMQEMGALVDKMNKGEIKTLFVHGVNPIFELPSAMGFAAALKNVPTVISFSSFPDETALQADYIFPDHTPLESWGYQRTWVGGV